MLPLNNARRRAWCAVLSALAGGGVTVVSLGGPLSGALGATTVPAETPSPTNGTTTTASVEQEARAEGARDGCADAGRRGSPQGGSAAPPARHPRQGSEALSDRDE